MANYKAEAETHAVSAKLWSKPHIATMHIQAKSAFAPGRDPIQNLQPNDDKNIINSFRNNIETQK